MSEQNHFSEQEIATCAEAIVNGTFKQLDAHYSLHLANCDLCANEVTMVSSILEEESISIPEIEATANIIPIKTFNLNKTIAWSAAAVIILFFGVKALINTSNNGDNTIAQVQATTSDSATYTQKADTQTITTIPVVNKQIAKKQVNKIQQQQILKPEKTELLAYATDPTMEKMVDRFSGAAMRGDEIKIITPFLLETTAKDLVLKWENSNQQTLIIEFFNNKAEKLFETETQASSYRPKKITKQGLYYWKLINQDYDLLFCGKIVLK